MFPLSVFVASHIPQGTSAACTAAAHCHAIGYRQTASASADFQPGTPGHGRRARAKCRAVCHAQRARSTATAPLRPALLPERTSVPGPNFKRPLVPEIG